MTALQEAPTTPIQQDKVRYPGAAIWRWDDVELGRKLGSGAFSTVYSVDTIIPKALQRSDTAQTSSLFDEVEQEDEKDFRRQDTGKFALKCLSNEILANEESAELALRCLVEEALILQDLPSHPNIIKLIGVSSNLGKNDDPNGFLLLQRVRETLASHLIDWKLRDSFYAIQPKRWGVLSKYLASNQEKVQAEARYFRHRARVQNFALGLARAMAFLHQQGIIYRDLKPSNIGIDFQGQVVLFDMGLARKLPKDGDEGEPRLLTRLVGTPRYMPPEIARSDGNYGFPADVHSFAIVLWQLLTLKTPYMKVKCMEGLLKVLQTSNKRPSLKSIPCPDMRELLKASWDPTPDRRPTFVLIVNQLEKCEMKIKLLGEDDADNLGMTSNRKKLTYSIPRSPRPISSNKQSATTA